MEESFYLGAYTRPLAFTLQQAAQFLNQYFTTVHQALPQLAQWHLLNDAVLDYASNSTEQNLETLQQYIIYEVKEELGKRTKVGLDFVDDSGFVLTFNHTPQFNGMNIQMRVGGHELSDNIIYYALEKATGFNYALVSTLMKVTVAGFEPKWATLTSYKLREEVTQQQNKEYFVGWLTYFSHQVKLPPLPFMPTEPLGTGLLAIATTETFSADNPEHAKGPLQLAETLRRHNLYKLKR